MKNTLINLIYKFFPSYYYLKRSKNKIFSNFFLYLLKRYKIFKYTFEKNNIYFSLNHFYSFEVFCLDFPNIEEKALLKIIKYLNNDPKNKVIFDIGSSLGFYTLLFSKIKNSEILSFEPFLETAKIQKKKFIIKQIY